MPWEETMSQTGTRFRASTSSSRTAYGAPEAPVIASTTGSAVATGQRTRRSSRAKANTVTLMMPFIVKKAASSRESSPGRTRLCS
jgi:hypothetical protein